MDLIKRQDAIDALGERPLAWTQSEYETGLQNQYDSDVEAIQNVLPAQQWIPCSERVPEDDNIYEVTVNGICKLEGMTPEVAYAVWTGKAWIMQGVYDWRNKAVVAWMPLPEPWKGNKDAK